MTIDQSSGQQSITAPNVTFDTTFCFYISSVILGSSSPIQKLISVTVLNCAVDFCSTCSSPSVCSVCNDNYTLSTSGTCNIQVVKPYEVGKGPVVTSLTTTGLSSAIISASGLANPSSLGSLWSSINQIQILYLLLLNKAYLPEDVKNVITGSKIISNPSSSIPFQSMSFYHSALINFDSKITNSDFETFGLNSNSSILNVGSFFISFVILIIIHILVIMLKKFADYLCFCNVCKYPRIATLWITEKCIVIMTYGYYIRFIMQMHQFFLVTSIYEIYTANLSHLFNILSFIFALLILLFCLIYTGVVLYLSLSSYKTIDKGRNKIGEFFMGIKMEKKYKFFVTVLTLRRTVFVILLITLISFSSKSLIIILSFIQLAYLLYVIFTKPYKEVKGNVIEIINEIYLLFLLSQLSIINEKSDWTSSRTSIYCYAFTSNSLVTLIIVLVDAVRLLIIKFKTRNSRPSEESDRGNSLSRPVSESHPVQSTSALQNRIGARSQRSVAPEPTIVTHKETEMSRNNNYMYEESKINLFENGPIAKLDRRKL